MLQACHAAFAELAYGHNATEVIVQRRLASDVNDAQEYMAACTELYDEMKDERVQQSTSLRMKTAVKQMLGLVPQYIWLIRVAAAVITIVVVYSAGYRRLFGQPL